MAIYETDKMEFRHADDANIPIDIWLTPPNEDCDKWTLRAANYMPRRGYMLPEAYKQTADTREELELLVKTYVLPLYEVALSEIKKIISGESNHLYYWQPKS